MLIYILRRLNLLLFTLLVLTMFAYWLDYRMGPGNSHALISGYFDYLRRVLAGDLGVSAISGRPVLESIMQHLPATLELCFAAAFLAALIGVPLGTLAALNQGRTLDAAILGFSLLGSSIPVYWLAQLLIMLFAMHFHLMPSSGQINLLYEIKPITGFMLIDSWLSLETYRWEAFTNALQHLCLPALALALLPTTEVTRLVRSSMLEVLRQNYIKAAFSRGWSLFSVITRHGLRNALPPILPQLSLQFGAIITSAFVIEQIFEWPGLGHWLINCIINRDYVAIEASLLLISSMLIVLSISTEVLSTLLYPAKRKELYGQQG